MTNSQYHKYVMAYGVPNTHDAICDSLLFLILRKWCPLVSVYVIGRFLTVLACATETMRRQPIGIELAARNLPCFFISQNPCDVTKKQENHELQPLRHVWHRHIYSEI